MKTWRSSKMRKYNKFIVVAGALVALAAPSAAMAGGNSDTAHACQQNGWQTVVRQDGTSFANQGDCVSYGAHGGTLKNKPTPPATQAVSAPVFNIDTKTCSVTVPYTAGIDTILYGVNGQPETPITHDVTVTGGLDGATGTAPQFWIGYTAQPGYVISNPGASPTHFDFYNGDYVRDC
jgi:hypothetical protein